MSEKEKTNLQNMIQAIQKSLTNAKKALTDESMSTFFDNLKAVHNQTTKAKNTTIDLALAFMDTAEEVE